MEKRKIEEENIRLNNVSVRLLEVKWLNEGGKTFLDLIRMLLLHKN